MNLHFNQKGFKFFDGAGTLASTTTALDGSTIPVNYYCIMAETAFTVSADSEWAKGFKGDDSWLGVEHPAGTYLMRFSSLVITAGTGIAMFE